MSMVNNLKIDELVNDHPLSAAVLSKLVIDKNVKKSTDYSKLNYINVSDSITEKIKNNEDIIRLFPDTELAMQIVVSSIVSPNDLTVTSARLEVPDIALPTTIKTQIIDMITDHIEKNYSPLTNLYNIVKEALFVKGAYAEICIPEASLDRLINGDLNGLSIESYIRDYNDKIFYKSNIETNLAIESLDIVKGKFYNKSKVLPLSPEDFNLEFTEDISILKFSDYKINKIATENKNNKNYEEKEMEIYIDNFFKKLNPNEVKPVEFVLRSEETIRENIGLPFVTKVPVEAVIPIYSTNDCTKHIGYFILLDQNGNFLDMERERVDAGNCNNYLSSNFREMLIDKAKRNLQGFTSSVPELENMEDIYNSVIEDLIKNRLRNSKYEELVDVSKNKEIYKVMLTRSLKNKKTKLLFVPNDLLQYYAFNYRNNGTGESLIEKSSVLYSIAGMMLMVNMVANIQNAIPQTEITVTIDELETDLAGAISKIQDNILKLRQANYPIGITNVNALSDWVQRAGLKFNYENENLPQTKIEMQSSNLDKPEVNQDFLDNIIGMINKSFGVTPEMVDASKEKEFATSIAADNLLFAKRIINWQTQLEPMLTKHIRMILNNDGVIKEKIYNILTSSKKEIKDKMKDIAKSKEITDDELEKIKDKYLVDYIIDFFFNKLEAKLARPEFTDQAAVNRNYDNFVSRIDKLVDLALGDNTFVSRFYKSVGENVGELSNMVKFGLIHSYICKNNIFEELTGMTSVDENGQCENPVFQEQLSWTTNIIKQYTTFLNELYIENKKIIPEYNKNLEKFDKLEEADTESGGSDFGGDDSSDSGSDDFGSDDMGMDDGLGDDTGMDDMGENSDEDKDDEEDIEDMTVEDVTDEDEEDKDK